MNIVVRYTVAALVGYVGARIVSRVVQRCALNNVIAKSDAEVEEILKEATTN